MNGLNDNHKRHLRVTFAYVDELLSEVLRDLDNEQAGSPFYRLIPDANPVQQKVIADYAARLRALMRSLLDHYKIPLPPPTISASWAAQTALSNAVIAILESEPSRMRGYGPLAEETSAELHSMIAQLLELLGKMEAYLAQGAARDLRMRLERLEERGPSIKLLEELERIITAYGLLEFRPTLETLLERLESPALEIGVFGRVKTGKSSLLNYILKTDVLPVGVTPITAVPTHICYGLQPLGKIWFAEDPMLTIELADLPEFATEQRNPANSKHVTRIEVEIPSQTLQQGVVFVDTPGIGSLALSGAAETMAYLPRCDLGIVLVDSTSALNSEDLALVDLLNRSGAKIMLLLSKADILTPADRQTTADYVRAQLQDNMGLEVPVYWVSTQGTGAELCDSWLTKVFVPLMQDHQHLAELSLYRKINGLREAVQSNLQRYLSTNSGVAGGNADKAPWTDLNQHFGEALAEFGAAQMDRIDVLGTATEQTEAVIDDVSRGIVIRYRANPKQLSEVDEWLIEAIDRRSADLAAKVSGSLLAIRAALVKTLDAAADEAGLPAIDEDDVPKPSNMPIMDSRSAVPASLKVSTRWRFLGDGILYRNVRKQLRETITSEVLNAFTSYGYQLERWRQSQLTELQKSYAAKSDFILAQTRTADVSVNQSPADQAALVKDLEMLRQFGSEDVALQNKL
ncbi:dynamin family protein [Methylobacter tundripaludum]|uniref:dynamin family protein n=1 Tax=Methylobacter tundripaludum TaxID=173365 RepID=UPI001376CBB0|nr:dynamin family protein [Methylobacter tundripaludum]